MRESNIPTSICHVEAKPNHLYGYMLVNHFEIQKFFAILFFLLFKGRKSLIAKAK